MAEAPKRKRRFGDRYDGYRVRELDPLFELIPHIMRSRIDSQIFFEEPIDISGLRKFVVSHRAEIPGLSMYQVLVAAIIRTIVQKPRINRFVSGRKIYARSYLRASLTLKKSMSEDGEEAIVTPEFEATDTLKDVVRRFQDAILEANPEGGDGSNGTDFTARFIGAFPGFIKKFVVWVLRCLDAFGKMPKIINRVSPFHSTIFVTNVGSIGIGSIYHHLYEFGTTSAFMSIGKKEVKHEVDREGHVSTKHFINIRFVLDERICDGYYYASAIKLFKYYMKNPELLLLPPDHISEDY